MSIFAELKRRNVIRVGIAYVITAWLLAQIADLVIDNIGAPDWVMKTLFLMLAIGFPLVLIFAWAFEMTPEGVKRESEIDRSQSITQNTGRKLDFAIIGVMAVALTWFAWDKFSSPVISRTVTTTETPSAVTVVESAPEETVEDTIEELIPEKSIAVLPFVNMSADQENEYFSDGLSEELLNLLAKVDGLKVAARTSTFKFKGKDADIEEIGAKLKVATVLEGSVRRAGNTARITAQLIKVDDGYHMWSETYDRELDDIFKVQDEIARAIVDALKLPLLGQDQKNIETLKAASFEAYDLYLLGKHHFRLRNEAAFEQAVDYFSRAVAIDPTYAPAWSRLADSYMLLADYGGMASGEAFDLAEKALDKALVLDPELVETLMVQATLYSYNNQYSKLEEAVEKVLKLDPNNIDALSELPTLLVDSDPERSFDAAHKAWELDPLAEHTRVLLIGQTSNFKGREAAESLAKKMLLDDPDNPGLHEALANTYRFNGLSHMAIREYELVWKLREGDAYPAWMIVLMYLRLDDPDAAEIWAERSRQRAPESRYSAFCTLALHWYKGEYETYLGLSSRMREGDQLWIVDIIMDRPNTDPARQKPGG